MVAISIKRVDRTTLALTQQNKIRVKNMQRGKICSFKIAHLLPFQTAMNKYILKDAISTVVLKILLGTSFEGRHSQYCMLLKMHRLLVRLQKVKTYQEMEILFSIWKMTCINNHFLIQFNV